MGRGRRDGLENPDRTLGSTFAGFYEGHRSVPICRNADAGGFRIHSPAVPLNINRTIS